MGGEATSDEKELLVFSRDASIFDIKPKVIARPKNVDDVKALVKFASEKEGVYLTARSAGTDMTGGPLGESIIVDFMAHFNRVLEVGDSSRLGSGEAGAYAIAEPGVYYRDFEKETMRKGLLLPSYPASREMCAIGGMVANNSGGEKSLKYGKTENYVEELKMVLSDGNEYVFKALNPEELESKKTQNDFEGEIYRKTYELIESNYDLIKNSKPKVSKNSAGYFLWNVWDREKFDLTRLITGSQGTLGLLTQAKFRLIRPKKYSRLLVLFLKELNSLGELVNAVNKYGPESFESYDDNTFRLAVKIFPSLLKKIGIGSAFRFLPDLWKIAVGGVPKMIMLIEFTGDDVNSLKEEIQKCRKEISDKFSVGTRIAGSAADAQKYWTIRRESFNLLRKHVKGRKTAPFIDDVIVRPEYLPEFLPKLNNILGRYSSKMIYTIAGHPGDGNFHIIPLMDFSDPASKQIIPELSEKVYDLVMEYHGSITAEHNDGIIRTPYLEKMYGKEICALFREVKNIFDPKNIFNPGKKTGGDPDYSKYIKH